MVDFRKAFLLLAVLAAVAILPLAADPMTCTASAGTPPPLRYEGVAEEVGQVTITCVGGTATARGAQLPTINVQIFLNTYITSKLLYNDGSQNLSYSEALLLLDEPNPRGGATAISADGTGLQTVATTVPNTSYPKAYGDGGYRGGANLDAICSGAVCTSTGDARYLRPNVFVGQQLANNSVSWLNIPFDAPGTNGNRVIRLVNLRAYAYNLGLSTGNGMPTSATMFISISGTASLSLSNPQLTVGYVQRGLSFSTNTYSGYYRNDTGIATQSLTPVSTFKQCAPPAGKYFLTTAATYYLLTLNFTENFGTAFRKNITSTDRQDMPSTIYNTESMFYNPDFHSTTYGGGALADGRYATQGTTYYPGLATQATRLIARFSNVPANVTLYIPYGRFYSTDYETTSGVSWDRFDSVYNGSGSTLQNDWSVTLTSGAGSAVFTNIDSTPGAISTTKIPVYVYYTAAALPDTTTVTVTGNYAPTTTTFTASYGGAVPRFVNDPTSSTSFQIIYCKTNLLFPFVTNVAGFDTGIAISNTSADPFGTVTQKGACTIYYYGTTNGTGAAPGSQTSGMVEPGSQLVFSLSGGGNLNVIATAGFQGYIIASCNFQYAHGYAFISDPGVQKWAQGYLALVMDADMGSVRTGNISEVLGN